MCTFSPSLSPGANDASRTDAGRRSTRRRSDPLIFPFSLGAGVPRRTHCTRSSSRDRPKFPGRKGRINRLFFHAWEGDGLCTTFFFSAWDRDRGISRHLLVHELRWRQTPEEPRCVVDLIHLKCFRVLHCLQDIYTKRDNSV